jgi:diguanylate cyclase (GGDEF)-like protein/PAS domain S-box-containing protein
MSKQPTGSGIWVAALAFGLVGLIAWQLWVGWVASDIYRFFLLLAWLGLLAYAAYSFLRLRAGAGRLRAALAAVESQKLALDRQTEQLRVAANALDNTVEGVMITNAERRIVSVNKSFTDITGYTAEEALGRTEVFLRASEDDAAFYAEVWDVVQKNGRWQGEVKRRRKNGEIFPQLHSISTVRDASGKTTHYVTVFSDISLSKENEARLEFLAHHDALTRLPNRALFHDRFQEALHRARRHGNPVGLMFIDLDQFKTINDSLGHETGDLLLQAAARRLEECVRETDTVARFGGDEFTILLDEITDSKDAVTVATKMLEALARPFVLAERELFISGSIGITCYPDDGGEVQVLLKNADAAMYRAKQQGRNNYQFFSADMNAHALENLVLTNDLRKALERDELLLHYQPRVALASGRITGVEALIRWRHPRLGLIAPMQFIPLAEETGLIEPIGEWVIKTACRQMQAWQASGLAPPRIAVNLSARQFRQANLPQRIVSILDETGLDARRLELEITESTVMHDPERARKMLAELHALGIAISIDDFGTGYSSLSYLKRFPIDYLKIDLSFVRELPHNPDDVAITQAIIAMANSLKLRVIAEGVETTEQRVFLHHEGCEEMQGYLFSRPRTAADLEALLRENSAAEPATGDFFQLSFPNAG